MGVECIQNPCICLPKNAPQPKDIFGVKLKQFADIASKDALRAEYCFQGSRTTNLPLWLQNLSLIFFDLVDDFFLVQ